MTLGEAAAILRRCKRLVMSHPMSNVDTLHLLSAISRIQARTGDGGRKPKRIKKGSDEWLARRVAEKAAGWHPRMLRVNR